MGTEEASDEFDDAEWNESMRHLPDIDGKDFWRMYCAGQEL